MSPRIAETRVRVVQCAADSVQERHRRQLEANIAFYAHRLDQIEHRLKELDEEWDIDRVI